MTVLGVAAYDFQHVRHISPRRGYFVHATTLTLTDNQVLFFDDVRHTIVALDKWQNDIKVLAKDLSNAIEIMVSCFCKLSAA